MKFFKQDFFQSGLFRSWFGSEEAEDIIHLSAKVIPRATCKSASGGGINRWQMEGRFRASRRNRCALKRKFASFLSSHLYNQPHRRMRPACRSIHAFIQPLFYQNVRYHRPISGRRFAGDLCPCQRGQERGLCAHPGRLQKPGYALLFPAHGQALLRDGQVLAITGLRHAAGQSR